MGWLKSVLKAMKWVATNEIVREAALGVVYTIIQKKAEEKAKKGQ